jgi:hypothetical protein
MRVTILLISVALFWIEWFVIRKTRINKFTSIIAAFLITIPIGAIVGLHLVAFPIFFILLAWVLCEVEDRYLKRKGMTETERAKLKDL